MKKMILRVSICDVDDNQDVADEVEEWLHSFDVNGDNFTASEVITDLMSIASLICIHFSVDPKDFRQCKEIIHQTHLELSGE